MQIAEVSGGGERPIMVPGNWGAPWVNRFDCEGLRAALARGHVPGDFVNKLAMLAEGDLSRRYIQKQCRTIIELVVAAETGAFKEIAEQDIRRMVSLLAYVRQDEDAICDYRPDGFVDDQKQVRLVAQEFEALLRRFNAWKLRYKVPALWNETLPAVPRLRTNHLDLKKSLY